MPGRARSLFAAVLGLGVAAFAMPSSAAAPAPAMGRRGMVVTGEVHATRAGLAMLEAGGNAVDAAVAASFALGVTEPFHTGIGGGGFLLIRMADGRTVAIDARETAPAAATRTMYVTPGVPADASREGSLAVATPGLLAGLVLALDRYGTLSLPEVMAPAIRLAEHGFAIGPHHAAILKFWRRAGLAKRFPRTARIQLPPAGTPIEPGWWLVQPDLARTLRRIARDGPEVFYRGAIAKAIAAEVQRRHGLLTRRDLARYVAKRREPVWGTYRGLTVVSFPPPSSGGVALLEMLNILEGFDLTKLGALSSASIHRVTEAMKLAFADRAGWLGDPDFVDVPVAGLVSKAYAARLRARIDPPWWKRPPWRWTVHEPAIRVNGPGDPWSFETRLDRRGAGAVGPGSGAGAKGPPSPASTNVPPGGGTAHLSVTDAAGDAVAITQTINLLFGSGITVPGTGIVLNDEMDDFSKAVDRPNAFGLVDVRGVNAVAPGKRPLSSMTPTIVLKNDKPYLVTGSPGGPRIISTVLETILNVVDWGMNPSQAVSAPRYHDQWIPRELVVEPAIPRDVIEALRARGHRVRVSKRNWSAAEMIEIDPTTGWQLGASDPRTDGLALGYGTAVSSGTACSKGE